jgi:hypothetical protein
MTKVRAILWGGLFVGLFDILDAIIFFGIRNGVPPSRIFQSIARGLLGRAAFSGGATTVALGALLHFFIATCIVATCVFLSQRLTLLASKPFVFGPLYGVAAFAVMNLVVLPLSAAGRAHFDALGLTNGILIHVLGVGIPSALAAREVRRSSGPS